MVVFNETFPKIANSHQLKTRNLNIGRNCLNEVPADTMASAVIRLETVSLVDGDLTEQQVEAILDRILSQNPEELQLKELDLREIKISSVSQEKLESVGRVVVLTTGMSDYNYYIPRLHSPLSESGSDSDSDSSSDDLLNLPLDQLIDAYHIP